MKLVFALFLVLGLAAGTAKAETPLDGTFNGTFSCPKYQGTTNALVTFIVTGNRVRALLTLYHSPTSNYVFRNSVIDYSGIYNGRKHIYSLSNLKPVGVQPSGWSYDNYIPGTVAANGSQITMAANASCTALVARRVTTTSALAK